MIEYVLIGLMVLSCGSALAVMWRDMWQHRAQMKNEPGNPIVQAVYTAVVVFLGTFGISDFAINTAVYAKTKWVSVRKMPGTLIAQSITYVTVAAITYITGVQIQLALLVSYLISQLLGTLVGVRISSRIPTRALQVIMAVSLLVAAVFILLGKLNLMQITGGVTELSVPQLVLTSCVAFALGIGKCCGVGTYPPTMVLMYFLGMSPLVAYPLMMGSGALSSPMAAVQFVKKDLYARRMTLLSSTIGLVVALIAVNFVKNMDVSALQWVVLVVAVYSAVTMLAPKKTAPKEQGDGTL